MSLAADIYYFLLILYDVSWLPFGFVFLQTNVEKASQDERREINRAILAVNSPRAKMNKKK